MTNRNKKQGGIHGERVGLYVLTMRIQRTRTWRRFSLRTLFGLLTFIALALGIGLHVVVEIKARHVLRAGSPLETRSRYRELFSTIPLSMLKRSAHDSIALQAALEEVKRKAPKADASQSTRPDGDELKSFFDFLERRAQVPIPKWWSDVFSNAHERRRNGLVSYRDSQKLYDDIVVSIRDFMAGKDHIFAPKGSKVHQHGDSFVLQIGRDSTSIPDPLFDGYRRENGHGLSLIVCKITGQFTPEHCYVAVHEEVGRPHTVACIDRKTGEIVWTSKACGCWWEGTNGTFESSVTVVVHNDRVVVFGAASTGFYVHGFRSDNGETLFQLSSSF